MMSDTNGGDTYARVREDGAHHRTVRYNIPAKGPRIETVGTTAVTHYIDAQREQMPTPKMFQDLGDVEATLVALSTALPEPYQDEALDLYQRAARLKRLLARERVDDEAAVGQLCYAGISELPEVTTETEHVTVDEDWNGEVPDDAE